MGVEAAGPLDEYGIPVIPAPVDVSQRKRQAIIDAALVEFLREGYSAASMDAITNRSGVSKATIYKHFGNKERLFLAVVGGILPQTYARLECGAAGVADAPDLRTALVDLAVDWAHILLRPDIMSLRRLVIGEIDRFPQLGQLWYRVTFDMYNAPLISAFTTLNERGELATPDPALAVQQFVAATVGVPQLVHTFRADAGTTEDELRRIIGSGVDLVLARYAAKA
ncbi:TetR/AcrR family transcriptional regulator [Kitasatospora indigofera]|uniref:TetR/AcrR family transcriptional regulator n=1 Tax=Kitasatospora indigofera TaxID=67307 RepID=UPI003246157B